MGKLRKTVLIFIIVLVQSALAAAAGLAALSLTAGGTLPPGIQVGGANIGGMGKIEASKVIDDYFTAKFSKSLFRISFSDTLYTIPFADFDVSVDSSSTVKFMEDWKSAAYIPNLIKAYFGHERLEVRPVIKYNEGKLRQKLIELAKEINKAPVNASVSVAGGEVVKMAETPGYELDIDSTAQAIGKHLSDGLDSPLVLDGKGSTMVRAINARLKLKEFEDIEQVLSVYSTEITVPELLASISTAAKAINGMVVSGSGTAASEKNGFSFVQVMKNSDKSFENDNEGYDQVASTLYAALLTAGIGKDAITRLPHKLAAEYIKPGLDAWISGNGGDLKFTNTLEHKIIIFARVEDHKLTIYLAGSLRDKRQSYELRVETIQKFTPPVVNLENKDLKPGEKIMLSPGKEGVLVQVFRNDELISEDKYDPEKAMVQIGPGTVWGDEEDK